MRRTVVIAAAALLLTALALAGLRPRRAEAGPPEKPAETSSESAAEADSEEFIDPLGPNSACYVCHVTFVQEELSKVHKAEKTGCIDCHGLSAAHANDEDIGATPPDIVYQRGQIDAACVKCHETHDAPAAKVVARFVVRKLSPSAAAVCTDCHGEHRIAEAAGEK
ncbi:MAG: cytochrome c3 family protein [Pirellulales bacterium]|nr:cytochrome c3 family protein [Pirellulales bacterium]